jgi:SAM-dependent methyltransferase
MTQESDPDAKKTTRNAIASPISRVASGLSWRARDQYAKIRDAKNKVEIFLRQMTSLNTPEKRLIGESQAYWNNPSSKSLKQNSHWRGVGIFADDARWLALGLEHLQLYQELARVVDLKQSPKRIVEWGCGGGMNAVHFGRLADEFYGVDISSSSLVECGRQTTAAGLQNFRPILIDSKAPEAALSQLPGACDLFISTYVFELLPTPEYGIRILRIACDLLATGGIALIQIKYSEGDKQTRSRAWAYAKNLAWNATYRIEDFWKAAQQCGFTPKTVTLQPEQPLVNDRNYAYFLLQKTS